MTASDPGLLGRADDAGLTRPLVLTADPRLGEELERLCAAAGLRPEMVTEPINARHRWTGASCVFIGDDLADAVTGAGLPPRRGLTLVSRSAHLGTWQRAVGLRAEAVVELPAEQRRLADLLAEQSRAGSGACVVGLVGARGGVGTSTAAATVALVAAAAKRTVVLIDADPDSCGLDVLLGCESTEGLRWPEVAAVKGRVGAEALRSSLPSTAGVAVLTWSVDGPMDVSPGIFGDIVTAASRGSELVVIDLGRRLDPDASWLISRLDLVLLVAGADLMSAAGARRLAIRLRPRCHDLRLVVRESRSGTVDPEMLRRVTDLPLGMVFRHSRQADQSINDGLGPVIGRRERRVAGRLVAEALAGSVR